jgi:Gene product 88
MRYCHPMTSLKRSSDRKTANSATAGGNVRIRNAFGILSGSANSCPGATSVCEAVCYAGRMEGQYPNVRKVMTENYRIVSTNALGDNVEALQAIVDDFRADCVKWDAPMEFRIHHDGDFFSREYALAWCEVILTNPDIQFWAYTRSFVPACNVVDILADIPNLSLYLSVDRDNVREAVKVLRQYPGVKSATLAPTIADAADLQRDAGRSRPGGACPENVKRIPLITETGGACHNCQLCVVGKSDIRFSISGK